MPPRTTCPLHTGDAPTPTADTTATSYGNARAPRTTPRIEISPDQVITLWYHWPDGDDAPSQPGFP